MTVAAKKKRGGGLTLSRGDVVGPGGRVGQFWTPPWLARLFCAWCRIGRGTRVLDVGAGMGALSLAAVERGAIVRAVERDERIVERVTPLLEQRVTLVHQDFLAPLDHRQIVIETGRAHDIAISNPPWEEDYPERFAERMLMHAPRIGLILPLNVLAGVERAKLWRHTSIRALRVLPRRPVFAGTGGGKRDVVLLQLTSRSTPRAAGDVDYAEIGVGE